MRFATLFIFALVTAASSVGALSEDRPLKSGIDRANFDTSVKPGDDFFHYVNGNWIKTHPIPPDMSNYGSFTELHEQSLAQLRTILQELESSRGRLDDERRKLRDFFATAMDESKLQQQGAEPLKPQLDAVAAVQDRGQLFEQIGRLHAQGNAAAFRIGVGQDEKNSAQYIVGLRQGGLSLPERAYYLLNDADSKKLREQFAQHVATMFELLGDAAETAHSEAADVLKLETELAKVSRTPTQLRDVEAQYNKKSFKELIELAPDLDWARYFAAIGAQPPAEVIVGQPEYFQRLSVLLATVSLDQWKTYLRWRVVHQDAQYLSSSFADEDFHFFGSILHGRKEQEPRWKRAVQTVDGMMGEALGRLYVERYFQPEARRRMDQLVQNIIEAYRDRIRTRDWMSEPTKEQALAKLDKVMRKIAFPDKWRDYSALQIGTDSLVQNVTGARAFEFAFRLSKLGKPVDRGEWGITPPTVNAYYNPSINEIVFPAGILQPPFFDPQADDAVNYGGIGAVIGHELSHGFDDQGHLFDADGNLRNWWTSEDKARFQSKVDALAREYDACVAMDQIHLNGKLTLGENIADLGGLTIAYAAYHRALNGKPAPVIDRFTGDQRFFLGYAQIWRASLTPQSLRVSLRTNPHSPPQFRCCVPLSNFAPFYDAFSIKPTDAMYRPPQQRVQVW